MSFQLKKVLIEKKDRKKIYEEMDDIFESGMLTLGKYTKRFEEKLSENLLGQDVITTNGGTSALEIAALALELEGHEVIVQSNTFVATPVSFIRAGAHVTFADCDKKYGALTVDEVKRLHTKKTKAVVMVHIGGIISPEVIKIQKYCKNNDLIFIEDAAHALGSKFESSPAGTFGDIATFSFYPTKIITSGEGGAITTKNKELSEKFKILRDQGKKDFNSNIHTQFGSNWRLSEVHAIIGYHQLNKLDQFIKSRKKVAEIYKNNLLNLGLEVILPERGISNWYKIIAKIDSKLNKEVIKKALINNGVKCEGEVYLLPCHKQPIFLPNNVSLPTTEEYTSSHICLGISSNMTEENAIEQSKLIKEVMKGILT